MSLKHRLRANRKGVKSPVSIPKWGELVKLKNDQLQPLAESLGVVWSDRAEVLSAVNKLRG